MQNNNIFSSFSFQVKIATGKAEEARVLKKLPEMIMVFPWPMRMSERVSEALGGSLPSFCHLPMVGAGSWHGCMVIYTL